jgi:hypothetical protein
MTTTSAPSIPFRIRKVLRATPALTTTLNAARALVHFGPWRHAARAVIRWKRPPLHEGVTRPASILSLNARELSRTLRGDGMARAGQLPPDVVRSVRAITDDLPPGEYGDFHEQPDIRALVLGADVLNVVRDYLGAEPALLECNLVVGQAEDPARTPVHVQRHFHFDFAGWQSLNLFVYLTDVEDDSGAHQVVLGTHRVRKVRDAIRPWVPDDEINARYPGRVRTIAGPAGTMFFENTEAFHRRLIFKRRRVMLNVLYASHRSWSSEGRLTPKYADYPQPTRASDATESS